jgi:hypothetical protein
MRIRVPVLVPAKAQEKATQLVFVFLNNRRASVPRDIIRRTAYGYAMYYEGTSWVSRDGIYFYSE